MKTKADCKIIGQKGEQIAFDYLQSIGYKLYAQNVRLGHDEIDIIAFDPEDKVLVFTEVKTRKNFHADYHPDLNITDIKKARMKRAVNTWIAEHDFEGGYRTDVIYIAGKKVIDHIKQID